MKKSETAPRAKEALAEETRQPDAPAAGPGPAGRNQREYLSVEQLSELTPWTPQAIRTLVSRGTLREGVHFFRPFGRGSRLIFRWTAVVDLIEGTNSCATPDGRIVLANGAVITLGEDDA